MTRLAFQLSDINIGINSNGSMKSNALKSKGLFAEIFQNIFALNSTKNNQVPKGISLGNISNIGNIINFNLNVLNKIEEPIIAKTEGMLSKKYAIEQLENNSNTFDISSVPYFESMFNIFGISQDKIKEIMSNSKIEGKGIELEKLISNLKDTVNQLADKGKSLVDNQSQKQIIDIMKHIGIADGNEKYMTLERVIANIEDLNNNLKGGNNLLNIEKKSDSLIKVKSVNNKVIEQKISKHQALLELKKLLTDSGFDKKKIDNFINNLEFNTSNNDTNIASIAGDIENIKKLKIDEKKDGSDTSKVLKKLLLNEGFDKEKVENFVNDLKIKEDINSDPVLYELLANMMTQIKQLDIEKNPVEKNTELNSFKEVKVKNQTILNNSENFIDKVISSEEKQVELKQANNIEIEEVKEPRRFENNVLGGLLNIENLSKEKFANKSVSNKSEDKQEKQVELKQANNIEIEEVKEPRRFENNVLGGLLSSENLSREKFANKSVSNKSEDKQEKQVELKQANNIKIEEVKEPRRFENNVLGLLNIENLSKEKFANKSVSNKSEDKQEKQVELKQANNIEIEEVKEPRRFENNVLGLLNIENLSKEKFANKSVSNKSEDKQEKQVELKQANNIEIEEVKEPRRFENNVLGGLLSSENLSKEKFANKGVSNKSEDKQEKQVELKQANNIEIEEVKEPRRFENNVLGGLSNIENLSRENFAYRIRTMVDSQDMKLNFNKRDENQIDLKQLNNTVIGQNNDTKIEEIEKNGIKLDNTIRQDKGLKIFQEVDNKIIKKKDKGMELNLNKRDENQIYNNNFIIEKTTDAKIEKFDKLQNDVILFSNISIDKPQKKSIKILKKDDIGSQKLEDRVIKNEEKQFNIVKNNDVLKDNIIMISQVGNEVIEKTPVEKQIRNKVEFSQMKDEKSVEAKITGKVEQIAEDKGFFNGIKLSKSKENITKPIESIKQPGQNNWLFENQFRESLSSQKISQPTVLEQNQSSKTFPAYLLEQVSRNILNSIDKNENEISFNLKPENLGRLQMTINKSDDGLKINIVAEQSSTKDILLTHVNELRTTLMDQGFKVEKIDVQISFNFEQSLSNFAQNDSRKSNSEKRNRGNLNSEDEDIGNILEVKQNKNMENIVNIIA